jgi:acylphosphatase
MDNEPSMRESLEAAYDESENTNSEESVETASEGTPDGGDGNAEATVPEAEAAPEAAPEEEVGEPAEPVAEVREEPDRPADPAPELKAPHSWKPGAREHWGNVPPKAREEIIRREREIDTALRESAEARKGFDRFQQITQPYETIMRMEGADPFSAVESLVHTAAGLRLGTPVQKAQIVANLVGYYGVDIQALDNVLSGTPMNDPQGQVQQIVQQQMQPFQNFMQEILQRQQQSQQQVASDMERQVAEFGADKEFFDDVREDMADLVDFAASRGRDMSLEQAYEQAVQMNPDIKAVLDQRKAASSANSIARKKAAGSSISGSPKGVGEGNGSLSLRSAIESAMEGQ